MGESIAIYLHDLTKRYDGVAVVNRLSLEVPAGAIFGYLGPNGAGKSTTLKMMTGVVAPDEGDVLIGDASIRHDALAAKRRIGSVVDTLALFDYLSIWEHLDLIRSVFDLSEETFRARAMQLLEVFDLVSDAGKMARHALAMALLPNPKVLILDEPFEGLDPVMAVNVKSALKQAAAKGTTIFLTTHILEAVEGLLTHYGILRQGVLVAQGTAEELARAGTTLQAEYLKHFDPAATEELAWLG
jgi:ABC-2 type transport system ATP-binding protein